MKVIITLQLGRFIKEKQNEGDIERENKNHSPFLLNYLLKFDMG